MKKTYITPMLSETATTVDRMLATSLRNQLGTEGMSGEEALVKEDDDTFWDTPEWSN
ncbi:MAG: hypothetical protein J6W75_02620 [Bacteroidaceae bacterium]|nr:hypothetical protein [Bacteroidaceae bacterium]